MSEVKSSGSGGAVVVHINDWDARGAHGVDCALTRCRVSINIANICLLEVFKFDSGISKSSSNRDFAQVVIVKVVFAWSQEFGHTVTHDKNLPLVACLRICGVHLYFKSFKIVLI